MRSMQFAGLDTHKESVQIHVVDGRAHRVREQLFPTDDLGLDRLAKVVGKATCVMEACSTCYPIYDSLTEQGIQVKVAHPLLLRTMSGLKKTDKVDARKLALMLKAGTIPEAHIPTKKVRLKRDLVKQHISLTQNGTREKNRVKAVLLRYRIRPEEKNLFGKRANWLEKNEIPDEIMPVLQQSLQHIQELKEKREQIDALIEKQAKKNKDAVLLQSIPGVGWFTAYLVVVFIDGIKRFQSPEQLVSYAGLAPSIYQSGNTRHTGHISKHGRPEIRWALCQCAWISVRKSKKFRKKYMKVKRKHGKKKAITAVARKMLTVMYFMLERKEAFKEDA